MVNQLRITAIRSLERKFRLLAEVILRAPAHVVEHFGELRAVVSNIVIIEMLTKIVERDLDLVESFNCNAKIDDLSLGVKRSVLSLPDV